MVKSGFVPHPRTWNKHVQMLDDELAESRFPGWLRLRMRGSENGGGGTFPQDLRYQSLSPLAASLTHAVTALQNPAAELICVQTQLTKAKPSYSDSIRSYGRQNSLNSRH